MKTSIKSTHAMKVNLLIKTLFACLIVAAFSFATISTWAEDPEDNARKAFDVWEKSPELARPEVLVNTDDNSFGLPLVAPCKPTTVIKTDQGAIGMVLLRGIVFNELIKAGANVCGAWGPWGPYAGECLVLRARRRERNCLKTDVFQTKHTCVYVPAPAWIGWVGTAETTHLHGGRFNQVSQSVEEEFEYGIFWKHAFATISDLKNAVATVTKGKELTVNYTGKRATAVVGSPFSVIPDPGLPPEIASLKYFIDGREVAVGRNAFLSNLGDRTFLVEFSTKSGGVVKFIVPFWVIKPVTVAETTQRTLKDGEVQYDVKIKNNNMVRASLAWVSISPFDIPGYSADIQGPKEFLLPPGESAVVSVLARPSDIRLSSQDKAPGVFEIIISSPTASGVVVDKMPLKMEQLVSTPTADSASLSGVVTVEMETENGQQVKLTMPADMRPGEPISFSAETQDTATLSGSVFDIGGKEYKPRNGIVTFDVPAAADAALAVILKNSAGREIGRKQIPINKNPGGVPAQPGNVALPRIGQTGQIVSIPLISDGVAANTRVTFTPNVAPATPTNIPVVAKSLRDTFVKVLSNTPTGPGTLSIEDMGVSKSFPLNVLKLSLLADQLSLRPGQATTLHAEITGMEGLVEDKYQVILNLKNLSPSVVRFNSTSSDSITTKITPNSRGVATFNETLTGIKAGAFTINGLLTALLN